MARSAASRATDEERARFESVARAMHESADAGDDIGFMRLDHDFNVLVSQANRNEFASEAISLMAASRGGSGSCTIARAGDLSMIARLHADIAIANRVR